MTLLIQVVGRTVTLSIVREQVLLKTVDATWQTGSGQSFVSFVQTLLAGYEIAAVEQIIACVDRPSYTTIRTVLAFANTLAWAQSIVLYEAPASLAHVSSDQLAIAITNATLIERKILFPTYE